jgi:flagellar basal-body rod protein FlgC
LLLYRKLFCLGLFFICLATYVFALGADDALRISSTGVAAQKARLKIIAENIANAATLKTETGLPYQKKQVILTNDDNGVKVAGVIKSQAPFPKIYDPANPLADKQGFVHLPNVVISEEMVNLSHANLLYEANVTAYKVGKSVFQQSIEILK